MYDAAKQSVNALLFSVFKDHLYHEISKYISHQTLLVTFLSIKQSFFISANLSEKGLSERSDLVGMNEASYEIRRVVEPRVGAAPAIREVRGQMGRRYTSPLFIYPVDGNAGTGGYFKPVLNTAHYATLVSEGQGRANWWPMITDGEALANDTAELLDDLLSNDR